MLNWWFAPVVPRVSSSQHIPVLIIGGGPAGAAAAQVLARQNIDCLLIDKARFPREKLCGGLLSWRSHKIYHTLFDRSWDEVIEARGHGIGLWYRNQRLREQDGEHPMAFTRRRRFDDFLRQQAEASGARMQLGDAVKQLDVENRICTLASGQTLSYDYVIGADGVNSVLARSLYGRAFNPETIAFALETEVPVTRSPREITRPEVYFGVVRWGYGWIFPKGETLTVGVGGVHRRNPAMKQALKDFLQEQFGDCSDLKIKGHHIPYGEFREPPGDAHSVLAGDAAGLVDGITGEGIAFAMQSGAAAARAVTAALDGADLQQAYAGEYRQITGDLVYARRLRYLLFPAWCERVLVRGLLPRNQRGVSMFLDLLAGATSYAALSAYLRGAFLRHLRHPLRLLRRLRTAKA